jgi:bifunctional DNA-binding transcriptional regulator/antitoxin component of YhaV-PrlF toxin-antitoxin module
VGNHDAQSITQVAEAGCLAVCGCGILRSEKLHGQKIQSKENVMDATVQVRKRGVITLPNTLREKYKIEEGETFRILDMDGVFILTPMAPMVPELAREIERARIEAGLTTDDLLASLRQQRERYYAEHYAPK